MLAASEPLPVDWWTLELAFGHVVPGHHAYLDRTTGDVVSVQEELPEAREAQRRITDAGDRYLRLEPVSSRDQHRWMVRFLPTVADLTLRTRLAGAIAQTGAFRAFKEILQSVPDERDRWFAYRKQMLRIHIERWLGDHGIPAGTAADLEQRAGPGLRRSGHALLDGLPAADLPTAIAFLMHLAARQDLGGDRR